MIDELLKLSKIFKAGFTVECSGHELKQYTNYDKPFIVSYKTLIEIRLDKIVYDNLQDIKDNCIIGGWFDSNTNTYYIEINKTFKSVYKAEAYAIEHNQKAFYNIRTGKTIYTREWKHAICECKKDYGVYKEHGEILCNKCGEIVKE